MKILKLIVILIISSCLWIIFYTFFNYITINTKLQLKKICDSFNSKKRNFQPNFVFILTDDQDSTTINIDLLKNVKELIADVGISFQNSFVASPLCCPSRSSILSGQYVHNHKAINNSINGGCSSKSWQHGPEKRSFINELHKAGYQTFFAGKYLNQYGKKSAGGIKHIPPGWDWWLGLEGNSRYYNYVLSVNGSAEIHRDLPKDYLTDVISRYALDFLNTIGSKIKRGRNKIKDVDKSVNEEISSPFFMLLSTPACHAPFQPSVKYATNFTDMKIPRAVNFNVLNDDSKHWLLRLGKQPLSSKTVDKLDEVYRNRLRTLLSVDEMVGKVINEVKSKNILEDTYIIFTSDNGFHLGQFSMPIDKRQPYEFDIRVPLYITGPNVVNRVTNYPTVNVDLAATILDLAKVTIPGYFDGTSLKPILHDWFHRNGELNSRIDLNRRFDVGLPKHTIEGRARASSNSKIYDVHGSSNNKEIVHNLESGNELIRSFKSKDYDIDNYSTTMLFNEPNGTFFLEIPVHSSSVTIRRNTNNRLFKLKPNGYFKYSSLFEFKSHKRDASLLSSNKNFIVRNLINISNNNSIERNLINVKFRNLSKIVFERAFLIEHTGEWHLSNDGCENLGAELYGCNPDYECKCSDSKNSSFDCVRYLKYNNRKENVLFPIKNFRSSRKFQSNNFKFSSLFENIIFCKFYDNENFEEFYDLDSDPYQLRNIAKTLNKHTKIKLRKLLKALKICNGASCNIFE